MKTNTILKGIMMLSLIASSNFVSNAQQPTEPVHKSMNPVELVNPFIDTHDSRWFYFSSACRPFGMVNLSPDTDTDRSWSSGYLYDSKYIRCLSHIHAWQLSGIAVLPATGKVQGHLGMDTYQSAFNHDSEIAKPGYHNLFLQSYDITVELTSTTRVGFHKYRFHKNDNPHVLFDLGAYLAHCPTIDTYAKVVSDTAIEGYTVMAPTIRRPKPATVFFVAHFDQPVEHVGGWKNETLLKTTVKEIEGDSTGIFVVFPESTEVLKMKVAISYTSIQNAHLNMQYELPHWDFEKVKQASFDVWKQWLNRIKISGGTRQQQVKFYTDLWHALQGRRIVSDVSGDYIDNTGNEPIIRRVRMKHGSPVYPHYNFDAWWISHWSVNILWSMAYPEVMAGFCNTMVDIYKNSGLIPRGYSGGNHVHVMIGDPASTFFATAYNKGIRDFDVDKAYEGILKNAFPGGIRDHAGYEYDSPATGGGMDYYVEQGWVPEGINPGHRAFHRAGASMTLEYAYQDWCIAQWAKNLDKKDDYETFIKRALNYKNLWNPNTRFMHPRNKDGSWIDDFSPVAEARHTKGFVESNAAIYTNFVPHDIAGLTELFGSKDAYIRFLNNSFKKAEPMGFVAKTKKLHATGWVNYANEPGHGMAHLFNHAGAPYLSQKWVRKVKAALNDTTPYGGYNGDEDQGKAGSLGVLMAIGLFQVDGGASVNPTYEITSPIFDSIVIKLDNRFYPGDRFIIDCKNNNAENMYIQSARLNGKPLNNCWFYHNEFIKGGKLELQLGKTPNKSWGTEILPPSMSRTENF